MKKIYVVSDNEGFLHCVGKVNGNTIAVANRCEDFDNVVFFDNVNINDKNAELNLGTRQIILPLDIIDIKRNRSFIKRFKLTCIDEWQKLGRNKELLSK